MKMVKIAILFTFIAIVVCYAQGKPDGEKQSPQKQQFHKYAHPFLGIKILLPPDWRVGEPPQTANISFYGQKMDDVTPRIDLAILKIKQNLADFVITYKNALQKQYPDTKVSQEENIKIWSKDAVQLNATLDKNIKAIYTLIIDGEKIFILLFSAPEKVFEKIKDAVNISMRSLKIFKEIQLKEDERKKFLNHYNAGIDFTVKQKLDDAIKEYKEAEKVHSDFDELHKRLATLYTLKKDYINAQKEFEKAVKLDPDDYEYNLGLGTSYIDLANTEYEKKKKIDDVIRGYCDSAFKYFTKAAELEPEREEPHTNIGAVYCFLDKLDKAKESLLKAIKLNPASVKAHYNLGIVYEGLKMYQESENEYKEALHLDSKHLGAKDGLKRVEKAKKEKK